MASRTATPDVTSDALNTLDPGLPAALEPGTPSTQTAVAVRRGPRAFWLWMTLVIAATAVLAALVVAQPRVTPTGNELPPIVVEPLYTPYELWLMELVRDGHIPKETLDSDTFRLKRLMNEGKVPRPRRR